MFCESGNLSVPSLSTATVTTPSRTLLRFRRFIGEVVASFETWLRNPHVFELALRLRCTALHSVTRALRMTYHGMPRNTQKYQGVPRNASKYPKETNIITSGQHKPNNTTRSTNRQDTSKNSQTEPHKTEEQGSNTEQEIT